MSKKLSKGDKDFRSFANIRKLLSLDIEKLKVLVEHNSLEEVRLELSQYIQSSESVRTGVSMTLDSALSLFSDENFEKVSASNNLNFSDFRQKKTILYLIVPEEKIKYSAPYLSLLYKQLFEYLLSHSDGLAVYVMMDEFGNMGYIPDFSTIITVSRKRNISISMIVQDIEQIKSLYKKDFHTILHGGCVNKIFYPGLGLETCKFISETIGKQTIETRSSTTISNMGRDLITPDEVRQLPDNKIIFISSNMSPIELESVPAYKNKKIKKKLSPFEGDTIDLDCDDVTVTDRLDVG